MFYILLFLPFLLFLLSSMHLNSKKLDETNSYVFLTSIFEAVMSYIIVMIFFLQGFLPIFLYVSCGCLTEPESKRISF